MQTQREERENVMSIEPRYSVIIPVYNAEKTIGRCLDSLLCQQRRDVQILLVNDGSTDGSAGLCKAYAENFECIVLIEKKNGGVSSARNAGLERADGKYVLFVDSDDYVTEDYFEVLDQVPENAAFVMLSYRIVDGKRNEQVCCPAFSSENAMQTRKKVSEALYRKTLNPPYAKRYLRRIIEENQIRFPEELYIGEDKAFNLSYALRCEDCVISPRQIYCVSLGNADSLTRKRRPDFERQMRQMNTRSQKILETADISEDYRQELFAAENLIILRSVYSRTKQMHRLRIKRRQRWPAIRKMCDSIAAMRLRLPDSRFSLLLQIPVKLKLVPVIDLAGWVLSGEKHWV